MRRLRTYFFYSSTFNYKAVTTLHADSQLIGADRLRRPYSFFGGI